MALARAAWQGPWLFCALGNSAPMYTQRAQAVQAVNFT